MKDQEVSVVTVGPSVLVGVEGQRVSVSSPASRIPSPAFVLDVLVEVPVLEAALLGSQERESVSEKGLEPKLERDQKAWQVAKPRLHRLSRPYEEHRHPARRARDLYIPYGVLQPCVCEASAGPTHPN